MFIERITYKIQDGSWPGIIKEIPNLNMKKLNASLIIYFNKSRWKFTNHNKPLKVVMQGKVDVGHRVWGSRVWESKLSNSEEKPYQKKYEQNSRKNRKIKNTKNIQKFESKNLKSK